MPVPHSVTIVGASLAGIRAAGTLRADGFAGPIVMIGAEPHHPYDRPPLSKEVLAGTWDAERVMLHTDEALAGFDIDFRLGRWIKLNGLPIGQNQGGDCFRLIGASW